MTHLSGWLRLVAMAAALVAVLAPAPVRAGCIADGNSCPQHHGMKARGGRSCCSNLCDQTTQLCVSCIPNGDFCSVPDQCCTATCNANKCCSSGLGGPCSSNADCCAGLCMSGTCG